jgi:hypothetical protein
MKTWEAIKALTENPKLEFREMKGTNGHKFLKCNLLGEIVCKVDHASYNTLLFTDTEWEPQPVPFMEAVKAYSEGKTIECEYNGSTSAYETDKINDTFCKLESLEVLEGTWYIKD